MSHHSTSSRLALAARSSSPAATARTFARPTSYHPGTAEQQRADRRAIRSVSRSPTPARKSSAAGRSGTRDRLPKTEWGRRYAAPPAPAPVTIPVPVAVARSFRLARQSLPRRLPAICTASHAARRHSAAIRVSPSGVHAARSPIIQRAQPLGIRLDAAYHGISARVHRSLSAASVKGFPCRIANHPKRKSPQRRFGSPRSRIACAA